MAVPSQTRDRDVPDCEQAGPGWGRPARRGRARVTGRRIGVALLALGVLVLIGQGSAGAGTPPGAALQPSPALNVMVFNIEDGGTLVSFAKVVEAIKASGADVVGIEEAQGHIPRLARLLGWPYYSTRYQVVSRFPLIDPPGSRGVYLLVEPQPGKVVAMMNVHLPSDPYGPYWVRDGSTAAKVIALEKKVRLPAIQAQLAALPSLLAHQIPAFLTGDFNSPSYLDWTPAAVGTRHYDGGKKPWPKYALEWPVSKAVVDAGFRDSFRDVYPDPVANPGLTWWAKKPHVSVSDENFGPLDVKDRIDYVYAAGASATTASRIVGESGGPQVSVSVSPWPSDHRGVVSSFDITAATPPVFVAVGRRLVNSGDPLKVTFHAPGGPNERVMITKADAGRTPEPEPIALQPTGAGAPTDGTLTFATKHFKAGHYRASLLDATGKVLSHSFFWMKARASGARVFTAKRVYRVGQPIVVRWRNTPGERWDWVGVYDRGADPNVAYYRLWGYTFASIAGHCTLDRSQPYFGYGPQAWPLRPGRYSVYLLRDDGYAVMARGAFRVVR
jgi:endonuclease/exonuclease/phosphatase family metal-dependent hydrolase